MALIHESAPADGIAEPRNRRAEDHAEADARQRAWEEFERGWSQPHVKGRAAFEAALEVYRDGLMMMAVRHFMRTGL